MIDYVIKCLAGKWKDLFFFMSLKPEQGSKQQQQDLNYGPKAEYMYQSVFNLWKHDSLFNTALSGRIYWKEFNKIRILKYKTGREYKSRKSIERSSYQNEILPC
jgi:hypothetical protein